MDSISSPFSDIISGYASSADYAAPVLKFQEVMAKHTAMSLGAVALDGVDIAHYSNPQDEPHKAIFASQALLRRLVEAADAQRQHKAFKMRFIGGLDFICTPAAASGKQRAWVFAGPVWETPPSKQQYDELEEFLGWDKKQARAAIMNHPAPVPINIRAAADMAEALAEFVVNVMNLREQQKQAINRLSTLYKISTSIGSSLNLEDILPAILKHSINTFKAYSGTVNLIDTDRRALSVFYKDSPDTPMDSFHNISIDGDIFKWIEGEGAPLIENANGSSLIKRPLTDNGRCIGFIKLEAHAPIQYGESDLRLLEIIADQSSSSLSKAIIYRRSMRQFDELKALQEIGDSLNASIGVPTILHKVLDHASDLLNAKYVSLMLLEPDGQYLRIRDAKGLSEEIIKKTKVKLGERVAGKVALQGEAMSLSKGYDAEGREMEAALCVPLKVDSKTIGVLNLRGNSTLNEYTDEDLNLASRLASMSAAAIENAELHDRLQELFVESITALANAIDARDPYTRGHSERVSSYSVIIGEKLGFKNEDIWNLRTAALLHDIGKIRIRDDILNKPGRLAPDEREEMERHSVYGAGIMMPVKSFRHLLPVILHHHERYDGGGYPDRKQGNEIPLFARIVAVADSFDAMTSDRPYRNGMPAEKAIHIICEEKGKQFDPDISSAFVEIYRDGGLDSILNNLHAKGGSKFGGEKVVVSPEGGKAVIWKSAKNSEAADAKPADSGAPAADIKRETADAETADSRPEKSDN